MGINLEYFVFKGRTYQPEDISFGDGETKDILINGGAKGTNTTIKIKKQQVTLTLRGGSDDDMVGIQNEREQNIKDLLRKREETEDLDFGGFVVEQALLLDFKPAAPTKIDGITIYETIELTYGSQIFS